ncbi:MAG: hypothetical protein F2667_00315 [Actinobacteria bacterium]|nr:hypothetical protein [Actinomycetota bacterium]
MTLQEFREPSRTKITRDPATARVVRADTSGVWVALIGSDVDTPVGPCRGGAGAGVGTIVLLVYTAQGPWIAATA